MTGREIGVLDSKLAKAAFDIINTLLLIITSMNINCIQDILRFLSKFFQPIIRDLIYYLACHNFHAK